MKKMKLLVGFLLTLILALGLTVAVFAAEEPYKYKVTVSSGSNGTVTNGSKSGTELEEMVAYDKASVTNLVSIGESAGYWGQPSDARYYFRGFHISGQENPVISSGDLLIEKDTVLVATYGVVGDMVNYTVNYRDASGATLYPTETLIGNVGDTPVVAYRYVDGYRPQNLTLSQTLDADATKNVFTFVYDPAPVENIVIDNGAGPAAPAAPAAPGAGGGNQPAGGGEGEEIDDGGAPLGPGGDDGQGGEEIETETAPLGPGPGGESQPETEPTPGKPGSALPWAIGGGAAVVIAAAIGVIVGVKKKKNK